VWVKKSWQENKLPSDLVARFTSWEAESGSLLDMTCY
jgi:hypothetical protein